MIAKKNVLMALAAVSLALTLNVSPIAPIMSANAGVEQMGSTRTTPCRNHKWKYVSAGTGSHFYYNYQCQICGEYKYSPWLGE